MNKTLATISCLTAQLALLAWTVPHAPAQPPEEQQVRIEARVLEWYVADELNVNFAVNFTGQAPGTNLESADLTLAADPMLQSATRIFFDGMDLDDVGSFDAVVELLEVAGNVSVLSKPSIIVPVAQNFDPNKMNAAPSAFTGNVRFGERVPYEQVRAIGNRLASVTQYKDTGVTLNVGVPMVRGNLVVIDMETIVNDHTGFIRIAHNNENQPTAVPTTNERTIKNRLVVPDRTVFIAGVMKTTQQTEQRAGIPWLSEIPLIGALISSRSDSYSDSELVFLVKPEIITPYRVLDIDFQEGETE